MVDKMTAWSSELGRIALPLEASRDHMGQLRRALAGG